MKNLPPKILNIYNQEYDIINFLDVITEDKLYEYINFFIEKQLNKSTVKFKVLGIENDTNQCTINIRILLDSYTVKNPNTGEIIREYPESKDYLGFYYQIIDHSSLNRFKT